MRDRETNILVAAVGGQGGLLSSRILATAALAEKLPVVVGETLGMAQRGGPVVSQVRIGGSGVLGPVVPRGHGDIVIGLEPIETLRISLQFLTRGGLVIMNQRRVVPIDVSLKLAEYPPLDTIIEHLHDITPKVMAFDATELAQKAGSVLSMNVVMIGALARTGRTPLSTETLKKSVKTCVAQRTRQQNLAAFDLGCEIAGALMQEWKR
jgi:indolepyruvate ferredoxin oxidoreductase beta subunit